MKHKPILMRNIKVEKQEVVSDQGYKSTTNDKIIGNIIIGVAGACSGIGCTHTAISIGYYLSKKKFKVAVLELNKKNDFIDIDDDYPIAMNDNSFTYNGLDFYNNKTSIIDLLSFNKYEYIILDCGQIKKSLKGEIINSESYAEFLRSNISLLVCGTKPWEMKDIAVSLFKDGKEDRSESRNWKILFNFTGTNIYKELRKDFDWDTFMLPFTPELFIDNEEQDYLFNKIINHLK